jgi:hypothetical protein
MREGDLKRSPSVFADFFILPILYLCFTEEEYDEKVFYSGVAGFRHCFLCR